MESQKLGDIRTVPHSSAIRQCKVAALSYRGARWVAFTEERKMIARAPDIRRLPRSLLRACPGSRRSTSARSQGTSNAGRRFCRFVISVFVYRQCTDLYSQRMLRECDVLWATSVPSESQWCASELDGHCRGTLDLSLCITSSNYMSQEGNWAQVPLLPDLHRLSHTSILMPVLSTSGLK